MVMVRSEAACFCTWLAGGRLTGSPLSRVKASDESIKKTSRKNIVSIIGMISILVRLSSRRRLNSMLSLLAHPTDAMVGPQLSPLLMVQFGQDIDELCSCLLGLRRDGAQA